jgi:putative glutamine amidotransferase
MAKYLLGLTGPSAFTQECIDMIEDFFDCDFVMLYHNKAAAIKKWVSACHGVILAGGIDMHPSCYGESVWNNQGFTGFDIRRDEREFQIAEECLNSGKPLLGICRGHQLLSVRLGFNIVPDLATSLVCHQPQRQQIKTEQREPMHSVRLLKPDEYFKDFPTAEKQPERSLFHEILGLKPKENIWTNSFHHQGVIYPGTRNIPEGVKVYGLSYTGITNAKEIVELMGGEKWLSCQWHPEYDWRVNTASKAVLDRFKNLLQKKR